MIKKLLGNLFKSQTTTSQTSTRQTLSLESLEPRMMLSTVSIFASGETGEESMRVYVGNEVRVFADVPTEGAVYVLEDVTLFQDDLVSIEFINDLYLPAQGIDRNLTVEKIVLDGQEILTTDEKVFADGVWDPVQQQLISGSGIGPTLHTNGFFDVFVDNEFFDVVEFGTFVWQVVNGGATRDTLAVDDTFNHLSISGSQGPLAISTPVDFGAPGEFYELSFVAERPVIQGQFTADGRPWATVGVDYYDASGNLLSQDRIDVNSAESMLYERQFQVRDNTSSAYIWIWIDEEAQGVDIPLNISNFELGPPDASSDVTPPIVSLETAPDVFTSPTGGRGSDIEISVSYVDESPIGFFEDAILVEGPNGYSKFAQPIAGSGIDEFSYVEISYLPLPPDGQWSPNENGTYTVRLLDDNVSDSLGNTAVGGVLGSFEVNI